jgi:hypothetical protein
MGKRTSIESEQQPAGKEIRLPADSTIKTFNSAFCEAQETVDGANEQLKDAADIAKKRHLNVWAFKICQKLYDDVKNAKNEALASEKLAVKLAQLDKIRKYFKLDELANLQGRMFAEGEIGAKGGEPPRERDEDGEEDPRPRHLRQPGASAASAEPGAAAKAVQDLAAKSGATLPDANLDKIGRGKPDDAGDTTKH